MSSVRTASGRACMSMSCDVWAQLTHQAQGVVPLQMALERIVMALLCTVKVGLAGCAPGRCLRDAHGTRAPTCSSLLLLCRGPFRLAAT